MDKFLKRQRPQENPSTSQAIKRTQLNTKDYPADPAKRQKILEHHPNDRDEIRRIYLNRGPNQPKACNFEPVQIGSVSRKFNPNWYADYAEWLEYSESSNKVYCLYCYLFNDNKQGGDVFSSEGFQCWNKKERLDRHVGGPNSFHNQAKKNCGVLTNQKQSIQTCLLRQTEQAKRDYHVRMNASITTAQLLLHQGIAFRGHDESEDSHNRGNFIEFLKVLTKDNKEMSRVVLKNAPKNQQMICPETQKDIANCVAKEVTKTIIDDLGDDFFGILVDESCDVSEKEQMAVVLRYVNKRGVVLERFLGIVHVRDTSALSLKEAISSLLTEHNLSLSRVRGKGYDGASNMSGQFNGLKSLILRENPSAFYIHCFAHQLQLALIYVARRNTDADSFFILLNQTINVLKVSEKRRDLLREKQAIKFVEELSHGNLSTGSGLNQELGLRRPGETRWGANYGSVLNMISNFSCVIEVLEVVAKEGAKQEQRSEAQRLLRSLQDFDFVLLMHLMKNLLGITNELSLALQRKDQDIENAISLVKIAKKRLQVVREEGWENLLEEVSSFCKENAINIPNMDERYVLQGKSARKAPHITYFHRYRVEVFCAIIDTQLQELNNRFDEINSELLLCVACLNPRNSFEDFDKEKLIKLASFYPCEFSNTDILALSNQLENYIADVRTRHEFSNLKGISELARIMVETKLDRVHCKVYLLVKLALILPVATAFVEGVFSAITYIKNDLRNKICDQWMNDCLVAYIEKELLEGITNDAILRRFQKMRPRRVQLDGF